MNSCSKYEVKKSNGGVTVHEAKKVITSGTYARNFSSFFGALICKVLIGLYILCERLVLSPLKSSLREPLPIYALIIGNNVLCVRIREGLHGGYTPYRFLSIFRRLLFASIVFLTVVVSKSNAATYYVSPSGNDSASGTTKITAWQTFAHAFTILTSGDTLILVNGTYHETLNPTVSGSSGHPITIRAESIGGAIIDMQTDGHAIKIYSSTTKIISHITIEGIIARGHGEFAAIVVNSSDSATEEQMTNNIIIRKTGAFGSANLTNTTVFSIGNNVKDSLFEDIWSYGYGRKALQAFGCFRVTIRRAVLRYDYWDGANYKPNDPRTTFSGYNTQDSIFENIIALDSAPTPIGRGGDRAGIVASGNQTPAILSGCRNNKYLGLISINNRGNGYEVSGGSGTGTSDLYFENIIAWGNSGIGFNVSSNNDKTSIINATVGANGSTGIRVDQYPATPITNATIRNSFSSNNTGAGYSYSSQQVIQFLNNTGIGNASANVEPQYAPTLDYVVRPDKITDHERGATMTNRYVDATLTNELLWPWPYEDLIKSHMCNPTDLALAHRIAQNGDDWEPGWCKSNKTLTKYIWEYLGTSIPPEIYNAQGSTRTPNAPSNLSIQSQ